MMKMISQFLFWTARVLGILFALLVSLFALDVFQVAKPIQEVLLAFLIHLIPTAIIVAALIIACRNGLIGGVMFILIGAAYIFQTWGTGWAVSLIFGGIPSLVGVLFILEWVIQRVGQRPVEEIPEGEA